MRSIALALLVAASLGFVGERPAEAAPCAQSARVGHVARRHHGGKHKPNEATPPAPAPASTAGGGFEGDNLDRVNAYRRAAGIAPVVLDAKLTTFARAGSVQLMGDHVPHQHFRSAGDSMWHQGFTGGAAENQGSNTGWPRAATDPVQNEQRQIDQILASMMSEGQGGGHFKNMMNPKAKRVGIGLVEDSEGKLYLTNDFSE